MPIPASTAPAAKTALLALMDAWTWQGGDPEVRWGGPTEGEDIPRDAELVYFGFVTITDDTYRLGAASWNENYNLQIVIDVLLDGDDEQSAELRCWELYGELLKILAANKTLSGAISYLDGEEQRTVRQTNQAVPNGWLARIVVDQPVVAVVQTP